jgi:SAM-dependent methyltransferase
MRRSMIHASIGGREVMSRRQGLVVAGVAVGVAAWISAAIRHGHRTMGREVPGGILVRDVRTYDALTHRWLLRGFYEGLARDVAAATPPGARLLDVGCGPGRLTILLARSDLHVTGVDLDPAMIERATANAARIPDAGHRPSFTVADVASVPLADDSQDVVVTTLSMHHWSDPRAGLAEIARVLRPGGKALVWDFRPGMVPLHRHVPDPVELARTSPLRVVGATPWRWPWRFRLMLRIELAKR